MENILIVLAIIGSVIYKIYTSYKEEMEKAAKRKQPPVQPIPVPPPIKQQIPSPAPPPVVPSMPAPQYSKKTTPFIRNKENIPDEVKKVQRDRLERDKKQIKKVEEIPSFGEVFQFDLRQAVIQSAILERPYK